MLCMAAPAYAACTIPGERVHWIADYCMATLSTDDEIAAGDCIARELARSKALADCPAVTHYKRAMCTLAVQRRRTGSVAACVADLGFVGSTVRDSGVGR